MGEAGIYILAIHFYRNKKTGKNWEKKKKKKKRGKKGRKEEKEKKIGGKGKKIFKMSLICFPV